MSELIEMSAEEYVETSDAFKVLVHQYQGGKINDTQMRVRACNISYDEDDIRRAVLLVERMKNTMKRFFWGFFILVTGIILGISTLISMFV